MKKTKRTPEQIEKSFWSKVDKKGDDDCWEWRGCKHPTRGYGTFSANKNYHAHRYSYAMIYGALPPRSCVFHTCKNKACVNPMHLSLGTVSDKPGRPPSIKWDDEKLKEMYLVQKKSCHTIAEELGVNHNSVNQRLRFLEIGRTRSQAGLGKISSRRADSHINKGGYRMVRLPNDSPFISMGILVTRWSLNSPKCYNVSEHRLVMAKHLNRSLERWEVVHHKNHVRLDNRIENLELMSSSTIHYSETITYSEMKKMKQKIKELEEIIRKMKEDA
jgi:hypothetical protein